MNIFDHKDLGNHLLQLCPKVVKHTVYVVANQSTLIEANLAVIGPLKSEYAIRLIQF